MGLRQRSNADLVEVCQPTRLERLLKGSGCLVPVLLSVSWFVGVVMAVPVPLNFGLAVLCAPLVLLGGFVALMTVADWRARREFAELQRRFGLAPFDDYLPDLEGVSGVFMRGVGLPHGDSYWICVRWEEGTATIEARVGRPFTQDKVTLEALAAFNLISRELSTEDADAIRALAALEMNSLSPRVVDGFPCEVAVLSSGHVRRATVNLAGLSAADGDEASVRLMRLLLSACQVSQVSLSTAPSDA